MEKGKIVWINGYPCSGKTFMGDYLASIGWHMVDGDRIGYDKDPARKEMYINLSLAYRAWTSGETAADNLWTPYYQELINEAKEEAMKGRNVTISLVSYKRYIRDWVRKVCPDIIFINLDVEIPTLLTRNAARMDRV